MKKAARNHSKIFQKHFLYKSKTSAKRITNTDVNAIHIISKKKSSITLKNNKSPGMDKINVGLMKYSPEVMHEKS